MNRCFLVGTGISEAHGPQCQRQYGFIAHRYEWRKTVFQMINRMCICRFMWSVGFTNTFATGRFRFQDFIITCYLFRCFWYFDWVKKVKWKSNTGKELARKITCWLPWWCFCSMECIWLRSETWKSWIVRRKYFGSWKSSQSKGIAVVAVGQQQDQRQPNQLFRQKMPPHHQYTMRLFWTPQTSTFRCICGVSLIRDDGKSSWRFTFKQSTLWQFYRRISACWTNSYRCNEDWFNFTHFVWSRDKLWWCANSMLNRRNWAQF